MIFILILEPSKFEPKFACFYNTIRNIRRMLISCQEVSTLVSNMFDGAKDHSNNGPAFMLAQMF